MKSRFAVALAIFLLYGAMAFAQDAPPKVEVSLDYSYVHANPQNNQFIPTFSLNGGGGGIAYYFTKYIGIEAEFEGYGSNTHNFTIPAGPYCDTTLGCSVSAQGNLFTYNVGPIFKYRTKHVEPFVEAMFGGAHSNFYGNLHNGCPTCTVTSTSPSNNAFDFIIGGGLDIPVGTHVAIRLAQVDYLLTRFGNAFTSGNNNQSNFRYQGGVVFRWGGAPPPPPNRPPVASCSATPSHIIDGSGDAVMVRADASDPDNDPLTYTWSATGGAVDGTGSQVRWNPAGVALGAYTITANVSDGRGGTVSCSAEVRVDPRPNRPPVISCSASPTSLQPGGKVHVTATASDPDNDPLTFSWESSGGQVAGSGSEVDLDTTGLAPSSYTVTGHVSDGRGGAAACRASFTVEPPPAVEARLAIRSIYFPTARPLPTSPDKGLVESQQKTLTSLANDFKEYLALKPDAHLELQGHADHRGTKEYNQALSERRVELTKKFLVGLGIPEASLTTKAYGEEDNMTPEQVQALVEQHPNLSQEQKDKILKNLKVVTLAQNRRVDVTLSNTGQQSVRQFPFNAEDSLTLLSPSNPGGQAAKKPAPAKKQQ
ncbi:MAG TPA: OmpA family protein [Candidatus Acidoferrum sp.]|nr:OmpA family protein [Candidatus Acidoferrum sp.]